MDASGRQVGRYTLIRRLASGGMGEVYLARTEGVADFSKQVAIKCILPHLAENREFVQKFIDEAKLMVLLQHSGIVSVIELFEESGRLYLVLEYVPGRDLKSLIREVANQGRTMPALIAVFITLKICEALEYAHGCQDETGAPLGIIHRDVTPSNILMSVTGEVKLSDFGIAKARTRMQASITGRLQGKFVYMSPEQALGERLDPRSDLFSLGLILYEMLTLKRPFDAENEPSILQKARECHIDKPRTLDSTIDTELEAIVIKLLSKDPEQRYDSAECLRDALSKYLQSKAALPSSSDLSRFLEQIFKGNVVPTEEEAKTLDQALLKQLDALTPSFGNRHLVTHTQNATQTIFPLENKPPLYSDSKATSNVSSKDTAHDDEAASRPTWARLIIGLVMLSTTALLASHVLSANEDQPERVIEDVLANGAEQAHSETKSANALVISEKRGQFQFTFKGPKPEDITLTVDSAPFKTSDMLPLERTYLVCATALGYESACQRTVLTKKKQPLFLELIKEAIVMVKRPPNQPELRIFIDDVEVNTFPIQLPHEKAHQICTVLGENLTQKNCVRRTFLPGDNLLDFSQQERLKPAKRELSSRPPKTDLRSIPVAQVFLDGKNLGFTPLKLPPVAIGKKLTLKAKGYLDTLFEVPEKPAREYLAQLVRPGYLTLRATPAASSIIIDGKVAGTGYLKRHALRPGKHRVELVFQTGAKGKRTWGPEIVVIEPGKEKNMRHLQVQTEARGDL